MINYNEFIRYYGPIIWKKFEKYINEQSGLHDARLPIIKINFYQNNKIHAPHSELPVRVRKKIVIETAERQEYEVRNKFGIKENRKKVVKRLKEENSGKLVVQDAKKSTSEDDWTIDYVDKGQFDLISVETEVMCDYSANIPIPGVEIVQTSDAECQTTGVFNGNPNAKVLEAVSKKMKAVTDIYHKSIRCYMNKCREYSDRIDWMGYETEMLFKELEKMSKANESLSALQKKEIESLRKGQGFTDMVLSDMYQRQLEIFATKYTKVVSQKEYKKTDYFHRKNDIFGDDITECSDVDLDYDY
jgi:hypothetical protein